MPFESNTETGRISVTKGSRQILVKLALFQLREHGHLRDDAMPNFFPDSKNFILGLSNDVSFVPGFFEEGCLNSQKRFLKTSSMV